jgi:hypothetical protein
MTAHWNGGSGGKGSAPRPYSVSQEEYATRWDAIFQRDLPKEETKNEYQDVLSTEDCVIDALDKVQK